METLLQSNIKNENDRSTVNHSNCLIKNLLNTSLLIWADNQIDKSQTINRFQKAFILVSDPLAFFLPSLCTCIDNPPGFSVAAIYNKVV
jgi:hypothetical protein